MNKRIKWADTLAEMGEERGFFRQLGDQHNALFIKGDSTLVVTFDNLDSVRQDVEDRMPWGCQFISSRGWSSLGIGAHGWTLIYKVPPFAMWLSFPRFGMHLGSPSEFLRPLHARGKECVPL